MKTEDDKSPFGAHLHDMIEQHKKMIREIEAGAKFVVVDDGETKDARNLCELITEQVGDDKFTIMVRLNKGLCV